MHSLLNLKLITQHKINHKFKSVFSTIPACSLLFPVIFGSADALEIKTVSENANIIVKVFDDANRNGIQDNNEHGIPGVRLATVSGLVLETDGYGRYHIPDNYINPMHARNFILKVDVTSLPIGAKIQSENPRVIRLTNNALNKVNFTINY